MFTPTITVALSVIVEMYQQYHQTGFLQNLQNLDCPDVKIAQLLQCRMTSSKNGLQQQLINDECALAIVAVSRRLNN